MGWQAYDRFEDPVDGTVWHIDAEFLTSNWTCIWGKGCKGILPEPAEHLNQGCCSHGAQFLDDEEAMNTGALAATLDPPRFQFHAEAVAGGIYADESRTLTRVVEGACIFHNRPGFAGGEGCALHLAAVDVGESPTTWKPSVCWQLPLRAETQEDGSNVLRHWARTDWDEENSTIAWCCTEEPEPYIGETTVIESLAEELTAMVGPEVYVEITRRLTPKS
ncbi:MAG: hypothetical protein EX269_00250 [Acidimicrobiales bacterium]|nr:MAG: hypothetical protein EX269_00250 [Acidimicrobiales bacterium]